MRNQASWFERDHRIMERLTARLTLPADLVAAFAAAAVAENAQMDQCMPVEPAGTADPSSGDPFAPI